MIATNLDCSGTFRKARDPFTMVDNRVIEDRSLSMKAKGLYLMIKHYITIPNFILNKNYLKSLSTEGERAFNSSWKELKELGYLKQFKSKGKGGKWVYEYELLNDSTCKDVENDEVVVEKITESVDEVKVDIAKKNKEKAPADQSKGDTKNKTISNDIICENEKEYTKTQKEILNLLKIHGIKKIDENIVFESFKNMNTLKACIGRCKDKFLNYLVTAYKNEEKRQSDIRDDYKKTGFHNFEETFTQYSEDELDDIIDKVQRAKFS